ncbi:MAG TPA: alpha/beta hydrolase [Brumimicrobium sp.]|nr:alpha/beta hydrolase [Brumimicrobium sp.]
MENLILIHGALGTKSEFDEVLPLLSKQYNVICYEIPHHGELQNSDNSFEIKELTRHFLSFLNEMGPSYVYGFSLGGYIALTAALSNETNFKGIVTQGTKFNWNLEEAKKETSSLSVDFLSNNAESFYSYLKDLHGEYLPELLEKTKNFMLDLGATPTLSPSTIGQLKIPVRITRGGKDRMVTKEESLSITEALSNGLYFEVPHMVHPLGYIAAKNIVRHIQTQIESFNYQQIETPYGKMTYCQYGRIENKEQPIALFLHEAIGSIAQWQNFPKELSESLLIPGIALEFPGYGFSEAEDKVRNEQYLHEFALNYLPAFIKALKIENPLFIVGHSDGGTNALLYSSAYPERVKGIVTLAAHYINEEETRAGIQPAVDAYKAGKLKGLEFFHGDKTERLFFAWAETWNLEGFKKWDITKDIKGNPVPALIIQGDKDQYGTDQQVNGIVELLENAEEYFVEDCGHAPHIERQWAVILAICQFYFTLDQ